MQYICIRNRKYSNIVKRRIKHHGCNAFAKVAEKNIFVLFATSWRILRFSFYVFYLNYTGALHTQNKDNCQTLLRNVV
jgi:hypothetical protein